jgi:hypothetical protein
VSENGGEGGSPGSGTENDDLGDAWKGIRIHV